MLDLYLQVWYYIIIARENTKGKVLKMKIGGKNGLTKNQFRTLIMNLQEIAHQLNEAKKENENHENMEDKENEK